MNESEEEFKHDKDLVYFDVIILDLHMPIMDGY
jgi:CheY-like chemotaxis protein